MGARLLGTTILITLMVLPHAAAAGPDPELLEMRVTPAHSFEPALLRIHMRVEPMQDNRRLMVATESESYYRSSTIPLEGDRAPRTHEMEYSGLPTGEYTVRAVLYGTTDELASVQRQFVVISNEASP